MEGIKRTSFNGLNIYEEEVFKVLRANIQFCGLDRKIKTIAITSCTPGEGKTTTSVNLAVSMALGGGKVLLVDADMRKPSSAKSFVPDNQLGLSNYISGAATFEDVLNETEVKGLYCIGSGVIPPLPAELLGAEKFSEFLKFVGEKFDMVVIDTPPLGVFIDSAIISARADGTILVIESDAVEFEQAKKVKAQLEKANAKVLGVVLNKVKKRSKDHYGKYYRYYKNIDRKTKARLI